EEGRDPSRDFGLRNADRDHGQASGELVVRGRDQATLEPGERQGHRRSDRDTRGRSAVRSEPGGNVEGDDRPAAGVDQLDRARDGPLGGAPRACTEERVEDEMGPRQRGGRRAIVLEAPRPNPAAAQLLELEPGVAADLGRRAREQHRRARAVALEPPRHDEAVAPVAALATDDDDARATAWRAEGGERGDDRVGGAVTGVLHEHGAGNAELGDRPSIEPPHLLGGEDLQHRYFPAGSGAAWTRKSARIAV